MCSFVFKAVLWNLVSLVLLCEVDAFSLIKEGKGASLVYWGEAPVVCSAIDMLIEDSKLVCTEPILKTTRLESQTILVGVLGENKKFDALLAQQCPQSLKIRGKWEAFFIQPVVLAGKSVLLVVGSDARGAAYGVLELSRQIGVSPWSWWADVTPLKKENVLWPQKKAYVQSPSVQYRGIFLNDEDWGLMPWSSKTFDPSSRQGEIGPKTYAKIFELFLRLRANTIWPAMHECSVPFYFVPGNREMAQKYGIILGTSHCEPMMRNSAREWSDKERGAYNFVTNPEGVAQYWEERLKELKQSENIYTIGMRGRHDGRMQGVTTVDHETEILQKVIQTERELLKKNLHPEVEKVPQVFVPYKEVLKVYNNGLKVPEDVTLMWTDDNFGYITRLSDEAEQKRKGGAGVYYHISYWGSPHDYLWLASTQPGLIYQQMKRAWESKAQKIWILNVGDIKPGEYLTEFFLDLAWNIDSIHSTTIRQHLTSWMNLQFPGFGKEIADVMNRYYDMAAQRKPEHMAWVAQENDPKVLFSEYNPYVFGDEIERRLADYESIAHASKALYEKMPEEKRDAYYQLVHYPVLGAVAMNKKILYMQKAYQLSPYKLPASQQYAQLSQDAYDEIVALSDYYNKEMQKGKWNRMMSMNPRGLSVFNNLPAPPCGQDSESEGLVFWVEGEEKPLSSSEKAIRLPDFTSERQEECFLVAYPKNGKKAVYSALNVLKGFEIQECVTPVPGELKLRIKAKAGVKPGEYSLKIKINETSYELLCRVKKGSTPLPRTFVEQKRSIAGKAVEQKNRQLNSSVIDSLGHSGKVLVLPKVQEMSSNQYAEYKVFTFSEGDFNLFVGTIPQHPKADSELRYAVVIDDQPAVVVSAKNPYRSKEWDKAVTRQQTLTCTKHTIDKPGLHTIRIYALDEDLYLDQWMWDFDLKRKFYRIPTQN